MIYANTNQELGLLDRGFKLICGIDEAGRGPWAGPVVAGCVAFDNLKDLPQVNDSKKLSDKQKDRLFDWITANMDYGVGIVDQDIIDDINILNATKLAMKLAVDNLSNYPDYLLIDAVNLYKEVPIIQENIIRGDEKVWSIAAASIIAKVTRDRLMIDYHLKYPEYSFHRHKGYGTKIHQEALCKYGICPIHRKSYKPVIKIMNSK